MNRMLKMMMIALVATGLTGSISHGGTLLQARADVPSRVFVNGAFVGVTPVDVALQQRGTASVSFRPLGARLDQSFLVQVPRRSSTITPLFAQFGFSGGRACAPVVAAPVYAPAYAPVVVTQPVIVARAPYYRGRRNYWR